MSSGDSGKVMTIEGPVDPGELGITLTHEHLFVDLRTYAPEPKNEEDRAFAERPLSIDMLGAIRRNIGCSKDALLNDDAETLLAEVMEFKKLGGQTIVDQSVVGIHLEEKGSRPRNHLQLARDSGLKIVLGSGYYVSSSHPPELAAKSVEELSEELMQEVREGIDGSGVRPGLIGEIGISQPAHPDEWKVLEAACRAQKETGLPLSIHPYFGTRSRIAPEIVRFVLRQGVDPARVDICHMDGHMNLDYQRRVADMGVWISFDTFGLEVYYDGLDFNHNCHDSQREEHLIALLDLGYVDQIMISQDVCMKIQLRRYGGYGYGHILANIVPSLRFDGVDEATIDKLLVENPRRFLTIG